MDLNNTNLIGRLTAEPQTKYLPSGSCCMEFTIANNGIKKDDVSYFDCVMFGEKAEKVSKYLNKGSQIAIVGCLKQERWVNNQINKQVSKVRIIVNSIQLLSKKNEEENPF